MEENLNAVFVTYIKEHRVRTVQSLLNEVLPTFYEHGFVFDDLLDALANYMNDSEDLILRECVPSIEQVIDHLRKLQTGSNYE
jgi:hypothetical protein